MGFETEMPFQRLCLPESGSQADTEQLITSHYTQNTGDADTLRRIIIDAADIFPQGSQVTDESPEPEYIEDTGIIQAELGQDIRVTGRRRIEVTKEAKSIEESLTIKDATSSTSYFHNKSESKNWSIEAWGWSGGSSKPSRPDIDWRECTCPGNKPEKPCRHIQARIRDGWG